MNKQNELRTNNLYEQLQESVMNAVLDFLSEEITVQQMDVEIHEACLRQQDGYNKLFTEGGEK